MPLRVFPSQSVSDVTAQQPDVSTDPQQSVSQPSSDQQGDASSIVIPPVDPQLPPIDFVQPAPVGSVDSQVLPGQSIQQNPDISSTIQPTAQLDETNPSSVPIESSPAEPVGDVPVGEVAVPQSANDALQSQVPPSGDVSVDSQPTQETSVQQQGAETVVQEQAPEKPEQEVTSETPALQQASDNSAQQIVTEATEKQTEQTTSVAALPSQNDVQSPAPSPSPDTQQEATAGTDAEQNEQSSDAPSEKKTLTLEEKLSGKAEQNTVSQVPSDAKTVLDVLYADHVIDKAQYDDVKVKSALNGQSADSVLQSMGVVPDDKIAEARAKLLGIPYISLTTTSFSPQALSFLPRAVVERFSLIPFTYDEKGKTLSIAMSNPVDLDAVAFIGQKTGLQIKTFAAAPSEVHTAIDQQYRQELVGEVGAAIKETEQYNAKRVVDSKQIAQIIKEAPIAKIVSTILEYAVTSRASDVHIEPQEDRVRVRYRIDGILYDKLSLPKNVQEALISRIKILSEMKIDEHRSPQDGRFNFKIATSEVDLRISIIPTVNGEKIVMRLLRKSGGIPTLPELGLAGLALKNLETAILRPHGIILVTGPTGSGKTTTLYAVLSRLNTPKVNIMSLEDPVEYQIGGLNQVQINPTAGLTFASGLRSFLRQDPNIILVGEIRDKETTELAMQAALTGHLVFSTLHTSTAAGALPRLIDLGAESFLLASTITAIVGQRIVRKVCNACKTDYPAPAQIVEEMKKVLGKLYIQKDGEAKFYKGKGCGECGNTGYIGRMGIYEVLVASEKVGKLVLERSDSTTIEKQAISEGMITMKQDGYLKVLQGSTTIEEVLRVAQE